LDPEALEVLQKAEACKFDDEFTSSIKAKILARMPEGMS
jgi:hypothetical protein